MDILRTDRKLIMVSLCNFSGFLSTAFIDSEKETDLADGIIATISPFKPLSIVKIRVDRAPGFTKLANMSEKLQTMGIDIEQGDAKNMNAIALVDQKMKELRMAMKKVDPSGNLVNSAVLARATTMVNETIRHHQLSAKEIVFSRSQVDSKNLDIDDEKIAETIGSFRNNNELNRRKYDKLQPAQSAGAQPGNLVFLKDDGDKANRRDIYIVLETEKDTNSATICKVRDMLNNNMASMVPHDPRYRYTVRQEAIKLAPNQPNIDEVKHNHWHDHQQDDGGGTDHHQPPQRGFWGEVSREHTRGRWSQEEGEEEEGRDIIYFKRDTVARRVPDIGPAAPVPPVLPVLPAHQPEDQPVEGEPQHDDHPGVDEDPDHALDAEVEEPDMGLEVPQHDLRGEEEGATAPPHGGDEGGEREEREAADVHNEIEGQELAHDQGGLDQDPGDLDQHRRPVGGDIVIYLDGGHWVKVRIKQ